MESSPEPSVEEIMALFKPTLPCISPLPESDVVRIQQKTQTVSEHLVEDRHACPLLDRVTLQPDLFFCIQRMCSLRCKLIEPKIDAAPRAAKLLNQSTNLLYKVENK